MWSEITTADMIMWLCLMAGKSTMLEELESIVVIVHLRQLCLREMNFLFSFYQT
uniref:Alternative protein PCOLCE2 n=1 Tax=Homo sapiens TaxID=9606 RepID=L8E804_HUMAN|nr:alternative protein PCOLCE2 [Homo sapiens]